MPDPQMSVEQFGATIKAKYPDYANVPDAEIGRRMLEKYPEYRDRVRTDSAPLPETRMPPGVPARGRGTQLDLDKSNALASVAVTPLAHPTGIDAIDGMTSPVGLVGVASGAAGIARAGLAGGVVPAVRAAVTEAAPYAKYHALKAVLVAAHVPAPLAEAAAFALSNRKGAAKETPVAPEGIAPPADLNAPHLDTSVPMRPSQMTQEQLGERLLYGKGTPGAKPPTTVQRPTGATVANPTGAVPASPSAEIPVAPASPSAASVRTDVPQSTAAAPPAAPPTVPADLGQALAKVKLTGREAMELQRLSKQGMPLQDALELIQGQRALKAKYGLTDPTVEETKFPKGNSGGSRPLQ